MADDEEAVGPDEEKAPPDDEEAPAPEEKASTSQPKDARGQSMKSRTNSLSVAAKNRNVFQVKVKQIFQGEAFAAAKALHTGIYIGWRCPDYFWDCFRLGDGSKCFCGHLLKAHQSYSGTSVKVPCAVTACHCPAFSFIPSYPEEVGEWWLRKRAGFDVKDWRAKCRCKHSHEDHRPWGLRPCIAKECRCQIFESNFLCAACDKKWELHHTYFETKDMRKMANLPFDEDYLPFAEMPKLKKIVLAGNEVRGSAPRSLTEDMGGTSTRSQALPFPSSGPWNTAQ